MKIEGLPQRLVAIREKNGYSRKDLSIKLNIPYRTITNYENGEREPGHSYIVKISKLFNVSTDYILGVEPIKEKTSELNGYQLSASEREGIKKYRTLDEYGKRAVDSILNIAYERCQKDSKNDMSGKLAVARNGQRVRINHVDNLDDLLPPDDSSDI